MLVTLDYLIHSLWQVGSCIQVYFPRVDLKGPTLVDIWEERKVFGSRGRSLKDEMLGKNPPPLVNSGKSSNPIKIVKRDASSVRIKLAVGGLLEKIFTAFQSVLDEYPAEEVALSNCNATVHNVGIIGQDVESALTQGNQQGSAVVDELQEQEVILKQCVGQLESAEATRASLISQLKEALQDQVWESKLEFIRTQLQVARDQIEQASKIRKRLTSPTVPCPPATNMNPTTEATTRVVEQNRLSVQSTSTLPQTALMQPVVSFAPTRTTEEENKKSAAAAVAAKLAASASSAQMLTSVLSSLVAEEVASMNGGINSTGFSSALSMFPPEKRPKLEKPMPVSDESSSDVSSTTYFTPLQQQPMTNVPPAPSTSSSQASQMQGPFAALPPPPPPPPLSPANPPVSQYVQSAGLVVMPYGYGANTLPPPPPLPPHVTMSLARTAPQPPGQPQPQPQQSQQQQQPATGGFYRPPGVGFYGQSHQPTTPPVPRQ
ncbi:formin-2-like isoform X5 [Juglans regia]|uniref:Formin-2-like isoform X5 n=1 Tax=Juglans regia TaxID=51240 RepID=A0A6P9EQH9_JUGRE|nr:formin-2-like isoform X5 [Juglans regia]